MNKEWRNILIFVGIIFIIGWIFFSEIDNIRVGEKPIIEEAGLYDKIEVGGLSFQLLEVELYGRNESEGQIDSMWWKYTITNKGEDIERVSDCGILLFEDGLQYEFQINLYGRIREGCNYQEIVPGAKIPLWYGFRFLESDYTIPWSDVAGSKITLFSEQGGGLMKHTINKNEIIYTD